MAFRFDTSRIYRLKNVSQQLYLSATAPDKVLALALDSVTDTAQQWRFFLSTSANTYTIQNVKIPTQYISHGTWNGSYYAAPLGTTQNVWSVSPDNTGKTQLSISGSYMLNFNGSIVVASSTSGTVTEWILTADATEGLLKMVKDPLPSGQYRIRTYNGENLLTMSKDATVYITRHLKGADIEYQTWSVTRDDTTGLYTIQNLRAGNFLTVGPGAERDGAFIIGKDDSTPSTWVVQSLNRGEKFLIGRPKTHLALGFADYIAEDLNNVRLKPADVIPSQIWFFETSHQITEDRPFSTRIFNAGGEFIIKSGYDQSYLAVQKIKNREFIDSGKRDAAAKFILEYVDAYSPVFTLRQSVYGGKGNYLADVENTLEMRGANTKDETKQWIAIPQSSENRTTCYICSASRGFPLVALTLGKAEDGAVFSLDEKVKGDVRQFWELEDPSG